MKKNLSLILTLVSASTFAATDISTTKVSNRFIKNFGISLGSSTLKTPNTTKGTQMLYGTNLTGSYEVDLGSYGLTTSTTLSLTFVQLNESENYNNQEYSEEYSYKSQINTVTLSQSINKRFETRAGILKTKLALGISNLTINNSDKTVTTYYAESDPNEDSSSKGSYSSFGKIIEIGTELELKNGITPYISYQTANYDPTKSTYSRNGVSETYKNPAFNLQTTTVGIGYKF